MHPLRVQDSEPVKIGETMRQTGSGSTEQLGKSRVRDKIVLLRFRDNCKQADGLQRPEHRVRFVRSVEQDVDQIMCRHIVRSEFGRIGTHRGRGSTSEEHGLRDR